MTVVPLDRLPPLDSNADVPLVALPERAGSFADALAGAFEATANALGRADASERAFAAHGAGLQEMVVERARADVMLSLASAAS
ncbi:MAG: hypothetical protein IAI49_03535 [Candidatus Eremiobacteraeota bacterium]|nr:hypothetical protein [Candidatus Eremiobacteraeota bacterium]